MKFVEFISSVQLSVVICFINFGLVNGVRSKFAIFIRIKYLSNVLPDFLIK